MRKSVKWFWIATLFTFLAGFIYGMAGGILPDPVVIGAIALGAGLIVAGIAMLRRGKK